MNETNQQPDEQKTLTLIEQHLRSIKSAVNFFVILAIVAIILQGCSALLR